MMILPKNGSIKNMNLSLEALGVLSTMINVPEYDYCTFEELCTTNEVDKPATVRKAINELLSKKYLIKTSKADTDIYSVNKAALIVDWDLS